VSQARQQQLNARNNQMTHEANRIAYLIELIDQHDNLTEMHDEVVWDDERLAIAIASEADNKANQIDALASYVAS
jgi:hypothetical protein